MSYIFKHWLEEHVTKLRDEHWPTNKEAVTRAAKAIATFPPSRIRGGQVVQSVRNVLHQSPLVGSWPLGWSELPCVCVCFSWACGLERRAKEQLGSEDAQRTYWSPVSEGLLQQILTEGDPMTLGSCTPGSQRRGTCASCSWTSSSSATSS